MTLLKENYTLENFEGPLDHLYFLLNKNELDIYQITLVELIEQFLLKQHVENENSTSNDNSRDKNNLEKNNLDRGAEFVSMAATLCWFKSKTLLPKHEQTEEDLSDIDADKNFEIIHHLVDYCRFKKAAKDLSDRELQQSSFYSRGIDPIIVKKNLGIDHLSLDDLAVLFQQILAKAVTKNGVIHEDEWKVSDKITLLKQLLEDSLSLKFTEVFHSSYCRIELIVTFLALLEMMKAGEIKVVFDAKINSVCVIKKID